MKYKMQNEKNDEIHTAVTLKYNLSHKSTTKEVMVGSGLLSKYRERNSNCRLLQSLTNEHLHQQVNWQICPRSGEMVEKVSIVKSCSLTCFSHSWSHLYQELIAIVTIIITVIVMIIITAVTVLFSLYLYLYSCLYLYNICRYLAPSLYCIVFADLVVFIVVAAVYVFICIFICVFTIFASSLYCICWLGRIQRGCR